MDHDDYIFTFEEWMNKVAFPQFDTIITRYKECSVDIVLFDLDLEDFKYALGYVKEQEGEYIDGMNELIDIYTDLNDEMNDLFEGVKEFDNTLLDGLDD